MRFRPVLRLIVGAFSGLVAGLFVAAVVANTEDQALKITTAGGITGTGLAVRRNYTHRRRARS